MNETASTTTSHEREVCPDCDSTNVHETIREQNFLYGVGEQAVTLTAEMPVFECQDCGYTFSDGRADHARHMAVCRHQGIFTPQEILTVRTRSRLSRAIFAALGRFGPASLARWETGVLLQNAANDQLIYLMQFSQVRKLLLSRRSKETLLTENEVQERSVLVFDLDPKKLSSEQQICKWPRVDPFERLPDRDRLDAAGKSWNLRRPS